jgi:hypothetical protein
MFITNGTWAGVALVFARTGGPGPKGVTCFMVPTDADGFTATLPVAIDVKAKLAIVTTRLPAAKVGRRYTGRIAVRGGVLPRTWRLLRGPQAPGLHLDTARGLIAGTPRRAGTYRITVRVRDSLGAISTATITFTVRR